MITKVHNILCTYLLLFHFLINEINFQKHQEY